MKTVNDKHLSKEMTRALRHKPWLYELELDEDGYVEIAQLLYALREKTYFADVTEADIRRIEAGMDKKRFQISGTKICALYGHSFDRRIRKTIQTPPAVLYHGTSARAAQLILVEGLKPMGRQYVHMAREIPDALQVGKRKGKDVVLLEIDAGKACDEGVVFYAGNDKIWLADQIPANYIQLSQMTFEE